MKKLVLALSLVLPLVAVAQPLTRSFPFTMISADTARSSDLPWRGDEVAGADGRIKVSNEGHFTTASGKRIRFFGTELNYGTNFLSGTEARQLARRFKKLGLNAVRINYTDHPAYNTASLIQYDAGNSYVVDPLSFAKLDTLIYELSQAGIYSIFSLQTIHYYWLGDGVAWRDSLISSPDYYFDHYLDNRAGTLQRNWAKTVLGHTNAVSNKKYADDPAIAAVEVHSIGVNGQYNFPLVTGWRYDWLNYRKGEQTITFNRSRRLDTLYTEYLLRKYGSEIGIDFAWRAGTVTNPPNLVENGNFEQTTSAAWSFAAANGSGGADALLSPGRDSEFCAWITVSNLGANPAAGDLYYLNLSTRCGIDTLYELRFSAKVRYSAQRPTLRRSVYTVVSPYNGGAQPIAQSIDLDTTWREFIIPFRATASGLQYLIFYLGDQMGDVLFVGVSIKRKQETGLFPGESAAARFIVRTPYARVAQVSYNRARDISLFYDSLQRNFYQRMIKAIHDTAKSPVLVNAFPNWYYSSALEPYANTVSDFAQCYINTDYMQGRPNIAYTDSTWMISNNTPLRDAGNYALGLVSSQSVEGKPMIVNFCNPTMNQHYASMLPFLTGYASLQDWDGIFISQYATYRENLFADRMFPAVGYSTFYDIAGNPSVVGQFPAMSELFRAGRFKVAENYVPIVHPKSEVELLPTISDYRHPFNVEGYLDPNISTNFKVRQRYNAPAKKVAAEYPYVPDTSAKVSDTQELYWSQSSGHFVAVGKTAASVAGTFGLDTLKLGGFGMRRTDNLRDAIAVTLFSMDTMPLGTSALTHLTIAGRGQNTGMVWTDSVGFGNKWGVAPTRMSAPTLEFYLQSDREYVYLHTLDESGNRLSSTRADMVDIEGKQFKMTVDPFEQNSMWYTIEQTNEPSGVRRDEGVADKFDVSVYPNPALSAAMIAVDMQSAAQVRLMLFDALGREVVRIAESRFDAGKYSVDLDVTSLPAGRYLLVAELGANRLVRSVSVVK